MFSIKEQDIFSLKTAGIFPVRPEMIKEIYFEKNYAATKTNKKEGGGKSRQNNNVTKKLNTNTR